MLYNLFVTEPFDCVSQFSKLNKCRMATASEHSLFKLCVEQPLKLNKELLNLNLQFINDPKPPEEAQETEETETLEVK